jgi:hypothetical protein
MSIISRYISRQMNEKSRGKCVASISFLSTHRSDCHIGVFLIIGGEAKVQQVYFDVNIVK